MTVYIRLVSKETVTLEGTSDVVRVWEKINAGEPMETGHGHDTVVVNKENVVSVESAR